MVFKKEFNYIGQEDSFITPKDGIYRFEAWGAQGGNVTSKYWNQDFRGGYGAYSIGSAFIRKGTQIYVSVGQKGGVSDAEKTFNGGGSAEKVTAYYTQIATGGGCTHFAFKSGVLSTLAQNDGSVILVAAGGGGAFTRMVNENSDSGSMEGGNGGGIEGSIPIYHIRAGYSAIVPTGGMQTRGGTSTTLWYGDTTDSSNPTMNGYFGQGGIYSGGGGGGWYGGASGSARAGAGGSSYISPFLINYRRVYVHMTCFNCKVSSEERTRTYNVSHASYLPLKDHAKLADGYAIVTLQSPILISCRYRNKNLLLQFVIISLIWS